jgi:hypothetical protein
MRVRTRHGVLYVALLALVAFLATLGSAFIHTDDGCAVEQHCRACRVALASAGALPASAVPVPAIQPAEALAPSGASASPTDPLVSDSNRGPPAAL